MEPKLTLSVNELLDPARMSEVAGVEIRSVSKKLISPEYARSGSKIYAVTTNGGSGPRFILKRVSMAWDWLMRSTEDTLCRSVTLWAHGILDQMPPEVATGVFGCAHDDGGWAILMQDVGELMIPFASFSRAECGRFLNAIAAMHARYWEMAALKVSDLGLCGLSQMYRMFSPSSARAEKEGDNNIPRRILEGWKLVQETLPRDVVDILQGLLDDPSPLVRALGRYPFTLVHGDWRHANLACKPGEYPLYVLDWQLAAAAPPAVDLARFLITNSPLLPYSKEESLEIYRQALADKLGSRYSAVWWEPQLALGLFGGFLQDGWAVVMKAGDWHVGEKHRDHWRLDLEWWVARVREGFKLL